MSRRDRDSNSGTAPMGTRGLSPALPRCLLSVSFRNGYVSALAIWHNGFLPPSLLPKRLRFPCPATGKPHACWCVWAQVPRSGLILLWHGRAGRSQTKRKPCPYGKKVYPPSFPQSRRWHTFPVEFLLTTGILLLSGNPESGLSLVHFCCRILAQKFCRPKSAHAPHRMALPRHNMPASTMTAWTTLRKVSAFTLFTTGMESRSPSTAKGHAEKHIVGYFRSVEAGRGLHGAGDQNAQKEVDAW